MNHPPFRQGTIGDSKALQLSKYGGLWRVVLGYLGSGLVEVINRLISIRITVSSAGVFPSGNNIALKGVTAFDASAFVSSAIGVEDVINRSNFQTAVTDACGTDSNCQRRVECQADRELQE
jgi:hypothetical protein